MSALSTAYSNETRVAVIWWLKEQAMREGRRADLNRVETIIDEAGADYHDAIKAYREHLAGRGGQAQMENHHARHTQREPEQPKTPRGIAATKDSDAYGPCPKCGTNMRGHGGLRCFTCLPYGTGTRHDAEKGKAKARKPKGKPEPEDEPEDNEPETITLPGAGEGPDDVHVGPPAPSADMLVPLTLEELSTVSNRVGRIVDILLLTKPQLREHVLAMVARAKL